MDTPIHTHAKHTENIGITGYFSPISNKNGEVVLAFDLAERDRQRSPPTDQERWGVIKDWLERHGVEAPGGLPVAPEMRGGKFV